MKILGINYLSESSISYMDDGKLKKGHHPSCTNKVIVMDKKDECEKILV